MSKSRIGLTDSFAQVSCKTAVIPKNFVVAPSPQHADTSSIPSAGVKRNLEAKDRADNFRPAKKARVAIKPGSSDESNDEQAAAYALISLFLPPPRASLVCSANKLLITYPSGMKRK